MRIAFTTLLLFFSRGIPRSCSLVKVIHPPSPPASYLQRGWCPGHGSRKRSRGAGITGETLGPHRQGCGRFRSGFSAENIAVIRACSRILYASSDGSIQDAPSSVSSKYIPTVNDTTLVSQALRSHTEDEDDERDVKFTPERRLKQVVKHLQRDIQERGTPLHDSRDYLNDLFSDLRENGATTPGAAPVQGSPALNDTSTLPHDNDLSARVATSSARGHDLDSLSDVLGRLQANARARDLAAAGARAAALSSGGLVPADTLAALHINKNEELKTRFASIRDARVSWAILPLILRARKAGIPLSTGVYNAAIAAYMSTPRKYTEALRVLRLLKDSGDPAVRPNLSSFNIAMRVCGEAGKWRVVLELLAEMQAAGIHPDVMSYNCALNGMAKSRQWYRARRLFRKMVADGPSPDAYSFNGLVEAAGMGSISPRQNMIQIVYDMEKAGLEPTKYTYTLLLDCLAQRGKLFDGIQVMARLVDARAPLLPLGYRAGLSFCKELGDWRRAMILMEDMRVAKLTISGVMYLNAVQACAKGGQWERALSLMVERRTLVAKEEAGGKGMRAANASPHAKQRAAEIEMKTLEAVLGAVAEAGQFEVALRLVQQFRAADKTPSKACYLHAMRAASKWGRWDVIEGLMAEMRSLGIGVVPKQCSFPSGEGREGQAVRVLSSDCYPSLVEAYAQASLWENTIETYREGFVFGRLDVDTVHYRVYECVLKACVATGDGRTALTVISRQAAEAHRATSLADSMARESSGGPPDRRCWCLAAEALGRAGMIDEGHGILRAMVNCGMPVRESTKTDVPSLMPLPPAAACGFDWHQRRRRRPRRRLENARNSHALTPRKEAALRGLVKPRRDESMLEDGSDITKTNLASVEPSKGVINGEACAAAAVAAAVAGGKRAHTQGGHRGLQLGQLLVSDWRDTSSETEREARRGGLRALERKRRRMEAYRDRRCKGNEAHRAVNERCEANDVVGTKPQSVVAGKEATQIELRPAARRGRDEALTLRMRARRSPGVLGRGLRQCRTVPVKK